MPNVTEYEGYHQRSDCFAMDESIDCLDVPMSNDHISSDIVTKEYFT
jgi:hypothetical protein